RDMRQAGGAALYRAVVEIGRALRSVDVADEVRRLRAQGSAGRLGDEVLVTPDGVVTVADVLVIRDGGAGVRVVGVRLAERLERERVEIGAVRVERVRGDEAD